MGIASALVLSALIQKSRFHEPFERLEGFTEAWSVIPAGRPCRGRQFPQRHGRPFDLQADPYMEGGNARLRCQPDSVLTISVSTRTIVPDNIALLPLPPLGQAGTASFIGQPGQSIRAVAVIALTWVEGPAARCHPATICCAISTH
jgi:hypothetical protein